MKKQNTVHIEPRRTIGIRDEKIYGHFLEHFHRQIYGGIYEPDSPLSDEKGFRKDVINALKEISPAIVRWPGGCYVSAYHWKDGVGKQRQPAFDKAWRVEESNIFGTDEFIDYCRLLGVEPYICTNAGSGTQEEMSDWLEYCNLKFEGKWAKLRVEYGHPEPFNVKYWSIGNENYYNSEIGAKSVAEWGRYVKEAAKMMKRVDPNIQLLAASTSDLDWNINLLREAGELLDWISIHDYWDPLSQDNNLSDYESCMVKSLRAGEKITRTRHILGALGYLGKIRIAFDEWNLRGWHHPNVDSKTEEYLTPRDKNDINASYTMADAVFSACFLNDCLRNCDIVGMANFAPTVNTRGMIYTYAGGIVLRPTYFVFELYTKYMGDTVVDTWMLENEDFEVIANGKTTVVPALDIVATIDSVSNYLRVSIVNRHPDKKMEVHLNSLCLENYLSAKMYSVWGDSKDSYNDVGNSSEVKILETDVKLDGDDKQLIGVLPHSVNILVFSRQ
jgi:alpha-L-arabinofuranosidase